MLKELEPFAGLLTTGVVGIILVIFRAEVTQLVGWITRFKRIEKTKEGYAVDTGTKPEPAPMQLPEKKEQAIAAVEAVALEVVDVEPPKALAAAPAGDRWMDAMFDKRYDDAKRLLNEEYEKTSDPEQRLTFKSVIGYVTFEQEATAGVAYFEALIAENPTKPQAYQWLALTYLWHDLPQKALIALDRGLLASDKKAGLLDTKSDCLVRLGRIDDAIAAAREGVERDPSFVSNYLNLARIYQKQEDHTSAKQWWEKAVEESHSADYVLEGYARFLLDHGTSEEAIRTFRELIRREPKNVTYHTLLGNAYLTAGFTSLALSSYFRANELANGAAGWVLANIGNLMKNQGFYGEACKYLKLAVQQEPESQYAHERLAQAQKLESEERERLSKLLDAATPSKALTSGEPPSN